MELAAMEFHEYLTFSNWWVGVRSMLLLLLFTIPAIIIAIIPILGLIALVVWIVTLIPWSIDITRKGILKSGFGINEISNYLNVANFVIGIQAIIMGFIIAAIPIYTIGLIPEIGPLLSFLVQITWGLMTNPLTVDIARGNFGSTPHKTEIQ